MVSADGAGTYSSTLDQFTPVDDTSKPRAVSVPLAAGKVRDCWKVCRNAGDEDFPRW